MRIVNSFTLFVRHIILAVLVVSSLCLDAQIRQEYVIASIGGYGQNAQGTTYYTVGEMSMIKTFNSGSYMLTQGFLQGSTPAIFTPNGGEELPVKLLDFLGSYESGTDHLEWHTASEIDNDHFEVQRMTSNGDFQSIGIVKGAGTSEIEHAYALIDYSPLSGVNYYRLKQVDVDGNYTYSDIISITTPVTENMVISTYPNPAKGYVNVLFSTSESQTGTVIMTDMLGKVIYQSQANLTAGTTQLRIDLSLYEDGQYIIKFVTITSSKTSKTSKIIKQS